jgi:hypothetical protein
MNELVYDWVKELKEKNPYAFEGKRVFEGGSQDQNGTVRPIFDDAECYVGVDLKDGKGVDVVTKIHEYDERPDGYFDVCLYLNTVTYDRQWKLSLRKMVHLLREGGSLIMTTPSLIYNLEYQVRYLLGWELPDNTTNYFRIKTPPEIKDCVLRHATFDVVSFNWVGGKAVIKSGIFLMKGSPCRYNVDHTYLEDQVGEHSRPMEL